MERIIIHWTAGAHRASVEDRKHYHFIIEGNGIVVKGDHPVIANAGTLQSGKYAAHTLNCNTGSIGVAVAAMAGAEERPFRAGAYPIFPTQLDALAVLCADLCRRYEIPVTRHTVLTHAEVQPTLGIKQRGKWDITWLPGMSSAGDPIKVGDDLRARITDRLRPLQPPPAPPAPAQPAATVGWWSTFIAAVARLFRRT
ncbi:N-acetylmuramoyl-L-alanine amidase [Cereibacter sp. SYSU M97828]|nr:N-acetylmuramoyl-L-alanine amidase [Cereibacter flavus]